MARFDTEITISYWWECEEMDEIPPDLMETLEQNGKQSVLLSIKAGYTSGELEHSLKYRGYGWITFNGWWNINTKRL